MKTKFAVGDRVAAYLAGHRCVGIVYEEIEHGNLKIKCDDGNAYGYPVVHPKQCRKLKPKKKPEVIEFECEWEEVEVHPDMYRITPDSPYNGLKRFLGKRTKVKVTVIE